MRETLIGQNSCTGMHTSLETEWFITLSRLIRIENKIKERMVNILAKKLDIIEDQIELGQVKTITSKGGTFVDFVELLFSPTTKAQFAPDDNLREIVFSVMDNNLDLPQLQCNMDKETLRNLIIALKSIYNQLDDESEDK